jgi:Arc/MetJ-type ribon-helix-helix transcriptional regulator
MNMERNQLNIRMSETLRKLIDAKRIELSSTLGNIPSRSDVLRYALEMYFGQDLSASEADRRKLPKEPRSDKVGKAD